jgi:predicted amidophosphoribosyltransferase
VLAAWIDDWLDLCLGSGCVGCGRPGRMLCAECRSTLPGEPRPVRPEPCPAGLARAYATAEYADLVRELILLHKEHRVFGLARPLGRLLAAAVVAGIVPGSRTLLVPVPSRSAVVRARGLDPLVRLVRAASVDLRARGIDVRVEPLLRQRERVADQAGLGATERARNLSGRIAARPRRLAAVARTRLPVTAIVCDDVLTTGSTAREAQRALEAVGVPVAAICCVAATRRRVRLPK